MPLPGGRTVALGQFATFAYGQEYPLVWRRDRVPTLTVRADVAPGVLPETVVDELAPAIAELNAGLPQGYAVAVGGIAEESAKSQASVFAVVPLMLLIMLTVLMFHLQSFQRLFMVLAILPLGLIGVVAALLVSGRPLGFVAILGILALIGMIAKNAVILITQIEADREEGRNVWDAVVSASSSRLRPMSLTAISTVLGLIPIAPTVFWGPMAFAIMGGLLVATMLTLVFLPTVYVTWFRGKEAAADARAGLGATLHGVVSDAGRDGGWRRARRSRDGWGFSCLWLVVSGVGIVDLVVGRGDRSRGGLGEPASPAARRAAAAAGRAGQARGALPLAVRRLPGRMLRGARSIPVCRCGRASCAVRCASRRLGAKRVLRLLEPAARHAGGRIGADGALRIHCLDVGQDVPAQMRAEEAAFRAARRASAMADLLLAAACFVLVMVALGLVRILRGPTRRRPDHGGAAARHRRDRGPAAARRGDRHGRGDRRRAVAGAARRLRLGRLRLRGRGPGRPRAQTADEPRSTSSRCSRSRRAPSSFSPARSGCCASPTR